MSNDTTTHTLTRRVGQRVLISGTGRFDGEATITKVNPKNLLVTTADGRRVNCSPVYLRDLAEGEQAPSATDILSEALTSHFTVGSLVRFKGATARQYPGIYVVLADKVEKVNVAKLGGDHDRYIRAPRATIEAVALENVVK